VAAIAPHLKEAALRIATYFAAAAEAQHRAPHRRNRRGTAQGPRRIQGPLARHTAPTERSQRQLSEADEEARRLEARIQQLADESRAANKQLEERIETLVSRSGEVPAKLAK